MNQPAAKSFQLGRLLVAIIPLAILVGGGLYAWGYLDLSEKLSRWGRPTLVPFKGRVMFEGKPLPGAIVDTQFADQKLDGAMGSTDEEGIFELSTDLVEGRQLGAFSGTHKITVRRPDPTATGGAGMPPMMTPPEYNDFSKTPLTITVDRSAAGKIVDVVMEGKARYANPELANAGGRKPVEIDPEKVQAEVRAGMDQYDTDKDGKISKEELAEIRVQWKSSLDVADTSGDGFIDAAELTKALERIWTALPGGVAFSGRGGGGGGQRGGGGGFDPAESFARLDEDKDDKLSAQEMEAIPEQFRDFVKARDKNSDGFVDKEEFMAESAGGQGGRPGAGPGAGGRPGAGPGAGGPPGPRPGGGPPARPGAEAGPAVGPGSSGNPAGAPAPK